MSSIITVIIPTFRRPLKLKRAIQSVLDQSYPHFKIQVYDNASGDETYKTVLNFMDKDKRISYFCHPQNIGSKANFQYGLSQVNSDFFSFLSDDDLLLPHFFETALENLSKFPQAYFFLGSTLDISIKKEVIAAPALSWKNSNLYKPPEGGYALLENYINWTGALFKKTVLKKVPSLDLNIEAIDMDFLIRAAFYYPFSFRPSPVALFTHTPNSESSQAALKLVYPGLDILLEKIQKEPSFSEEAKTKAKALLKKSLKSNLFRTGIQSWEKRELDMTKSIFDVYFKKYPSPLKQKFLNIFIYLSFHKKWIHKLFLKTLTLYRKKKRSQINQLYQKSLLEKIQF